MEISGSKYAIIERIAVGNEEEIILMSWFMFSSRYYFRRIFKHRSRGEFFNTSEICFKENY